MAIRKKNSKRNVYSNFKENKVKHLPKRTVVKPVTKKVIIPQKDLPQKVNDMIENGFSELLRNQNNNCFICGNQYTQERSIKEVSRLPIGVTEYLGEYVDSVLGTTINSEIDPDTFELVCDECAKSHFVEEVDPKVEPTNELLTSIALKNYLNDFESRQQEHLFYTSPKESVKFTGTAEEVSDYQALYELIMKSVDDNEKELTKSDYEDDLSKIKVCLDNPTYQLVHCETLPYKTNIAVQSLVVPSDNNEDGIDLHLCVYPLETETIILYFHEGHTFSDYATYFNNLAANEKLVEMNRQLLTTTESYYINAKLFGQDLNLLTKMALLNQPLSLHGGVSDDFNNLLVV